MRDSFFGKSQEQEEVSETPNLRENYRKGGLFVIEARMSFPVEVICDVLPTSLVFLPVE